MYKTFQMCNEDRTEAFIVAKNSFFAKQIAKRLYCWQSSQIEIIRVIDLKVASK